MSDQLLSVGAVAPSFTLLNQQGEKVSLAQFKGKARVLLYFYPKAMTPGCTVQACGLRDGQKTLKSLGVEVLGVSFIIGINGKIEAVMAKVNTKTHFDDVVELLKQF